MTGTVLDCGTFRTRSSPWIWISASCAFLILFAYLSLLTANIVYLGWHDALFFFTKGRLWSRLWLTVRTAAVATLISMSLAVPAGYILSRRKFRHSSLVDTIIDLPVMIPPAAVGVFLFGVVGTEPVVSILNWLGIRFAHHSSGVVLCQVFVTAAFAVRLSKAAFDAVPLRYEQVARSLGASRFRVFSSVSLPIASGGLTAALLVVFARAAAEWEALMLFVGATQGETDILPFAVYLDWNGGLMGWVVSMSVLSFFLAMFVSGLARIAGGKSNAW